MKGAILFIAGSINLFFPFLVNAQSFFGSKPFIQNYNNKDFNTVENQVWSIVEADNGLMFFGHNNGILVFDASEWKTVTVPNKSYVRSLAKGKDERIYVGAVNEFGYVDLNDSLGYEFHSLTSLIEDTSIQWDDVWDVFALSDEVIFCTYSGLFIYKNEKIDIVKPNRKFSRAAIQDDQVILSQDNSGLYRLTDNHELEFLEGTELIKTNVRFIEKFDEETWMIGVDELGIVFYDLKRKKLFEKDEFQNITSLLKENKLYFGSRIGDQTYALGTFYSGILVIDEKGNIVNRYDTDSGLSDNMVFYIKKDEKGNLWAGLNHGISYVLRSAPFSILNEDLGLKGGATNSFVYHDKLIIGSMSGTYYKYKNSPLTILPKTIGPTGNFINIDDNIYFAHYNGLLKFTDNEVEIITPSITRSVIRLSKPPNHVIGATYDKGLVLYEISENTLKFKNAIEGFDDISQFMAQDKEGYIWVTDVIKGIYRLTLDSTLQKIVKTDLFTSANGLPANINNKIITLNTIESDPKIIAATEKGIYHFNSQTNQFEEYSLLKPWVDYQKKIEIISESDNGNIYIGYEDRIVILEKTSGKGYTIVEKPLYKIQNINTEGISSSDSCNVLISADDGLIIYNRCRSVQADHNFDVIVPQLSINERELFIEPSSEIEDLSLPYSKNNLKFYYTALFFEDHEKTSFSIKLEGFDKDWSDWNSSNVKEYTNLPPGNYVFRVKARNIYQIEESAKPISFAVLRPWYLTYFAILIYVAVVLLVIWVVVKMRTRRLEREKIALEQIIRERTKDISHQKDQIEAQSKELEDANQMKDKLFSIIAHDLRSPLNSLSCLLKLANNNLLTEEEFKKLIPQLTQNVTANNQLLNNLLNWSKSQLKTSTVEPERFQINCVIEANINLFEKQSSEKKIQITFKKDRDYTCFADKNMIDLVVRNVVANAIKFTPVGGSIQIWLSKEGNNLLVHIADNGQGISKENLQKIFGKEMFSTRGTQDEKGTGLGLKLCKEFVSKNRGEFFVESEEGKGSHFYFSVPV